MPRSYALMIGIFYLVGCVSGAILWSVSMDTSPDTSEDCPLVIGRTVALKEEVDNTIAWPRGGITAVKVVAVSWALDVTVGKTVAVGVGIVIGRILAVLVAVGLTAEVDVGLMVAVGGTTDAEAESKSHQNMTLKNKVVSS